jgi:hypothetical protein
LSSDKSAIDDKNEFVLQKGDRLIILLFRYVLDPNDTNNIHAIIRFNIKAEYVRLDPKKIEYKVEIKLKIK